MGIWLVSAAMAQAGKLDFPEPLKELKAAPEVQSVVADFPFTNSSGKSVTITKSDPDCPCLHVQVKGGKMSYAPGESGLLRATFDITNFSGQVEKNVGIWLDGDAVPSQKITVKVDIPVLVKIEPKTVVWKVGEEPAPKTIRITMNGEKPIRVLKATSSAAFATEVRTVEEGKTYDLVLAPMATGAAIVAPVRIETDCPIARHKIQQAFGAVTKKEPEP